MVGTTHTVGVLALQGAFREHVLVLQRLGVKTRQVRLPEELTGLDGLVIPGGESTTMGKLMESYGLTDALRNFAGQKPVFGTCAGMIMLARRTAEGSQSLLGVLDVTVRRNAFGRQLHSFEAPVQLDLPGKGPSSFPAVFIRSPWVEEKGPGVHSVARYGEHVVGVLQDDILATAFHPELTEDVRLHQFFLELVGRARARGLAGQEVA